MGNSYGAARSMWWYGTSSSSSTFQDDMAIISSSTNGFGYRLDDYGNTSGSASPLSVAGNGTFSVNGVIERMSDLDTFSFSTAGGAVTLSAAVPAPYNNLDARIEVRDAAGNLVASEDSGASYSATVSFTAAPGTYYVTVASHGVSPSATANNYGQSVGQFTLSGTIVPGQPSGPAAPSNLAASAASSTQVNLTWTDNAGDEDGFKIERYDNGVWTQVATVGANVTSWQDAGRAASTTYTYRVRAYNASGDSAFSNTASATTPAAPQVPSAPAAPSGLTGAYKSKPSRRVNLTWVDNANNETGFRVYRSTDGGATWTLLTQLGANATSYSDSAVVSGSSYRYRVLAYNDIGTSAVSNEVTVSIGITSGKGNHGAALGDASDDLTPAYQSGPSDNASQTAWLNALRYWLDRDAELNENVVM